MIVKRDTWHYRMFEEYFNRTHRYHRHRKFGTPYTDYWTFDDISQGRVSLCQYFWIVVLIAPMLKLGRFIERHAAKVFATAMTTVVAVVSTVIIVNVGIVAFLIGVGSILAGTGLVVGLIYLTFRYEDSDFKISETLPAEYIKARKQRVCPILEFEGDNNGT